MFLNVLFWMKKKPPPYEGGGLMFFIVLLWINCWCRSRNHTYLYNLTNSQRNAPKNAPKRMPCSFPVCGTRIGMRCTHTRCAKVARTKPTASPPDYAKN
jgi:hypothetical protein